MVYRAIEPDVNKTKNQLSGYNNTWLREESSMSREAAIFSLDDSFPDKKYKYCKGNPVIVQEVPVAYEPVTRQDQ